MAFNVVQNSRLRFAAMGTVVGFTFWDLLDLPTIQPQPDDISYQVTGADRLDTIANRFYGDPVLWWVIAAANDIEIVPTELNPGAFITVPSPRYVTQQLFRTALSS